MSQNLSVSRPDQTDSQVGPLSAADTAGRGSCSWTVQLCCTLQPRTHMMYSTLIRPKTLSVARVTKLVMPRASTDSVLRATKFSAPSSIAPAHPVYQQPCYHGNKGFRINPFLYNVVVVVDRGDRAWPVCCVRVSVGVCYRRRFTKASV